ncbi:alkaline phosphatase D family protein [Corynebacterium breve]|uniref:Alkaline phosphatase D family protein n=2 Tax=Corynebacterium breve TaxID=3049799 RepID=A0ABY8VHR0_9CORY|nr:alkaline phosphatase D family protein [Corynebacterium breve]WIM69074.1 alkaline phosphatase D family protein [Corynebacterium breve]
MRSSVIVGAAAVVPTSQNTAQLVGAARANDATHSQPEAYAAHEHRTFMHGVASGDPLPATVMLWTRITPTPEAVPGSGLGEPVEVSWEIALDQEFTSTIRAGHTVTTAEHDHTVNVDPFGLEPDTTYFYRFHALGETSRLGKTRTAPAADATPEKLTLAVCSCANYEAGYFQAYSDIAQRGWDDELDIVVHMGDYIYEYASGEYAGKFGVVRPHSPRHEIRTLSDYRTRYGAYRRDTALQDAHAALPWVVTWDDHEIADDSWEGGSKNHATADGDWGSRRDAAMQAYLEWLPIRGTAPSRGGHIYRSLSFGTLADIHMLDLRSYRSEPGFFNPARAGNKKRTIMGSEQFQWLQGRLETSRATWDLIGTSVMMAPLDLKPLENSVAKPLAEMVGLDLAGTPVNLDQWDGYVADRERLLANLDGKTMFLTGDIHSEWANQIEHEGRVVAAEMVCSSVSAPNIDDILQTPPDSALSRTAEGVVRAHNPHIKHVDLDAHGYAIAEITSEQCQMTWLRVDDVTVAGSPVQMGPKMSFDGSVLA